ncbi:MAG: DNA topoisomerase IV, partial [Sulfurimonas sp.]
GEVNTEELAEEELSAEVESLEDMDLNLDLEESASEEDALDDMDDLNLDDSEVEEVNLEKPAEEEIDDEVESLDEMNLEDELSIEEDSQEVSSEESDIAEETNLNIDDIKDEDLESEIENAVLELSDEELESELDADTLLEIAVSDIDGLESLNTRDIKLAIGEEVGDEEVASDTLDEVVQSDEVESLQETNLDIDPSNEGVESLKKLLAALSNEDVVASMKGMKININITLGDK